MSEQLDDRLKRIDALFFNLMPLKGFDRRLLLNEPEFVKTDSLILMFCMAWNDLKANLIFASTVSIQAETVKKGINPQIGQISGLQLTLIKQQAVIINEFLALLQKESKTLETKIFQDVLKNINFETRDNWN